MSAPNPKTAAARIKRLSRLRPQLAMVLGSGFHHLLAGAAVEVRRPFSAIPGFPSVGVDGHAGELVLGRLEGIPVLFLNGRVHFYEGHPMDRVTFSVRALAEFGIRDLLLTNAAGGINPRFRAGDLMLVTDHINGMGVNPLRGLGAGDGAARRTPDSRPRFVDLTRAYDAELSGLLARAARAQGVRLRRGVYLAVSGPSYETPAEIRAFRRWGADAVGMSTVPEVIVARQCGLRVAALSCITNLAADTSRGELSHAEVLETSGRVKEVAARLLKTFVKLYGEKRQGEVGAGGSGSPA